MRIARTIGLAALAAMALMASLGAGSAAAAETTLCKTATASPYCDSGNRYPAETSIEADLTGSLTIETDWGAPWFDSVECTESSLDAKTASVSGAPLKVNVSAWTLGKCVVSKSPTSTCSVLSTKAGKEGSLAWGAGSDGTLSVGATWSLECWAGPYYVLECSFTVAANAEFDGSSKAQLDLTDEQLAKQGPFCPSKASLDVTYDVASPQPAYVGKVREVPKSHTRLCKAKATPCAEANTYLVGTLLKAESDDFTIETNILDFSCDDAALTFEVQEGTGGDLPLEMVSSSFAYCNTNLGGICNVIDSANQSGLSWYSGYVGTLEITSASWDFECSMGGTIYYWSFQTSEWSTPLTPTGYSEEEPVAGFKYMKMPVECGGICSPSASLSADYRIVSPEPVYVTHVN